MSGSSVPYSFPQNMTTSTQQPSKKHGCLFYGCITLLILAVVTVVALGITAYFGVRYFKGKIIEYSESHPRPLPEVRFEPTQLLALRRRIEDFAIALKSGESTAPLRLTAEDINILINGDQRFSKIKGKAYITITDRLIRTEVSIPLGEMGFPNRYLNGSAEVTVSHDGALLHISLQNLEVRGQALPDDVLSQVRGLNLAEEIRKDPQFRDAMRMIRAIRIEDGAILIEGVTEATA